MSNPAWITLIEGLSIHPQFKSAQIGYPDQAFKINDTQVEISYQ